MKKVLILACATFLSSQLMAQTTTAKAATRQPAPAAAEAKMTKAEVASTIGATLPSETKATAATAETRLANEAQPATEMKAAAPELQKTPVPVPSKPKE